MPVTDHHSANAAPGSDNLQPPPATAEGKRLLRDILCFRDDWADNQRLRLSLFQPGCWDIVFAAASELRLMPALVGRVEQRNLTPPAPTNNSDDVSHPSEVLRLQKKYHDEGRVAFREVLLEAIKALNKCGVQPILLKGARYLWTQSNPTRTMRDIDLLIEDQDIERSNTALLELGYAASGADANRVNRHHLPSLFHPARPGWIELHRRAGNPYAEAIFPTGRLLEELQISTQSGLSVRLPNDAIHIWHALVHHQFGHSGFARGEIHLKPLYELALALEHMDQQTFEQLESLAASSNLARATLDLWVAGARHGLACQIPFSSVLEEEFQNLSMRWLERAEEDNTESGKYPGYRELLRLAWRSETRLRRGNTGFLLPERLRDLILLAPKIRF